MFDYNKNTFDKKLRIAFVIDVYPTISTFIINQITGLIDLGHEVYIYPSGKKDITEGEIERNYNLKNHVYYPSNFIGNRKNKYSVFFKTILKNLYFTPKQTIYTLNPFIHGKRAFQLHLYFKYLYLLGKQIDIIQAHYGMFGNKALELKKIGWAAPIFTMFHGFDIRTALKEGSHIYNELFAKGDYFQAISKFNYNHLVNFGAPKNKIISHTVGIELDKFIYKPRLQKDNDPLIIMSTGRLVWEKGYEFALEAMRILEMTGLDFEYRIIGDGNLKDELLDLTKNLKLNERVKFLGLKNQEDIITELESAHIFLMASVAEVLPLVLMESLASGIPTISTDVGSTSEIIIDKKTGLLIPSKNPSAIAEAITWLVSNEEDWKEYANSGRAHVEKYFDINKLNVKLEKSYLEAVRKQ